MQPQPLVTVAAGAALQSCPGSQAARPSLRGAVLHARLCTRREKVSSALFFKHNTQLGPPYQVLVDTNFINFSIRNKVR